MQPPRGTRKGQDRHKNTASSNVNLNHLSAGGPLSPSSSFLSWYFGVVITFVLATKHAKGRP